MQQKDTNYTELFIKILKEHGGRLTEERQILLQTVCNMKDHFEAEDIHQALIKKGHKISLATIYRNIMLIAEAGIIRRACLAHEDQSSMKFECVWGKQHHDHLICMGCGKRIEFAYPAIEVLQEAVARDHGFVLSGHYLELLGLCAECQEKNTEPVSRLVDLKPGSVAKIIRLSGGKSIVRRLHGFGLREGKLVRVVRFAPFGGPLLIEDTESQSRIMTARDMAAHVIVKELGYDK
jgi:Fur family transcriptional regulator, ferric uptake regulator